MNETKKRNYNLDLLRTLSMCGVVGLHLMNQGGVVTNYNINSINYYFINILLTLFFLSVNTFALLSGYFSYKKSNVKNKRIIELVFIAAFYAFLYTLIFYFFNLFDVRSHGFKEVVVSIFPPIKGMWWYITCYMLVFFMIPFLNKFINSISKKDYKKIMFLLFILLSVIPSILFMKDFFKIMEGYSSIWLIYLYLLGAYISKYNNDFNKNIKYYIKIFICLLLISSSINFLVKILSKILFNHFVLENWFINYISPFNVIESCLLIIIFNKINKNYNNRINKLIQFLSLSSFSVYIGHTHYLVFTYLNKDILLSYMDYNFVNLTFIIISLIMLIYIGLSLFDQIRKLIFNLFKINKLIDFIGSKFDNILSL